MTFNNYFVFNINYNIKSYIVAHCIQIIYVVMNNFVYLYIVVYDEILLLAQNKILLNLILLYVISFLFLYYYLYLNYKKNKQNPINY